MKISMYLGQWDDSLDPIEQTGLTKVHIMLNSRVNNRSGGGGEVHPH